MTRRKTATAAAFSAVRTRSTPPAAMPLVTLDMDGIVHFDYSPCDGITLEAVQYANIRHREFSPGFKSPVLLTGGKVGNVEYKAQRFASSPEACNVTAAFALVARSFLERHLAKMFLMYHRPPYPTRVFRTEAEALVWLREFVIPPTQAGVLTK